MIDAALYFINVAIRRFNGFSFNMNIFKIYMSVSLKDAALSTLKTADTQ